jgi:hypothetical protein
MEYWWTPLGLDYCLFRRNGSAVDSTEIGRSLLNLTVWYINTKAIIRANAGLDELGLSPEIGAKYLLRYPMMDRMSCDAKCLPETYLAVFEPHCWYCWSASGYFIFFITDNAGRVGD